MVHQVDEEMIRVKIITAVSHAIRLTAVISFPDVVSLLHFTLHSLTIRIKR